MNFTTRAAWAVLAAILAPASVQAAESYDTCKGYITTLPATISTQGVWCLSADVSTAVTTGHAIKIATNNVTLDCNGYKVGGLAAGTATDAMGIYSEYGVRNATVRNCTVRGFRTGIFLRGDGHVVENNRADANTYSGIHTDGEGNVVRGNSVNDTGGMPNEAYGFGIIVFGNGVRVLGNDIQGVSPAGNLGGDRAPTGIWLENGTAQGNRIGGLVQSGTSEARGVYGDKSIMLDNVIAQAPAVFGLGMTGVASMCRDNTIKGFTQGVGACAEHDNVVQLP